MFDMRKACQRHKVTEIVNSAYSNSNVFGWNFVLDYFKKECGQCDNIEGCVVAQGLGLKDALESDITNKIPN